MNILVLDLDETLIKSFSYDEDIHREILQTDNRFKIIEVLSLKSNRTEYTKFITVERPHLRRFLCYAKSKFDHVCVWTAGVREYASEIVNKFFPYDPFITWARENIKDGSKDLSYFREYISDLTKTPTHEIKIYMVDDLEENCTNSNECHIISKFNPFKDDDHLLNLIDYYNSEIN